MIQKHTVESHCEHCGLTTLGKVHGECARCGRTHHSERTVVTPEWAESEERQANAARIARNEEIKRQRQDAARAVRRLLKEGWHGALYYRTPEQRRTQARKLLGK